MLNLLLLSAAKRTRDASKQPAETLAQEYLLRIARYSPAEFATFASEEALLRMASRQPGRAAGTLILFDSAGLSLGSEQFAQLIGRLRDEGAQRLLFAVGPADGWSKAALTQAHHVISLGRMTLPHELARVVVAEQVYRAFTILAGHPYHSGH